MRILVRGERFEVVECGQTGYLIFRQGRRAVFGGGGDGVRLLKGKRMIDRENTNYFTHILQSLDENASSVTLAVIKRP